MEFTEQIFVAVLIVCSALIIGLVVWTLDDSGCDFRCNQGRNCKCKYRRK